MKTLVVRLFCLLTLLLPGMVQSVHAQGCRVDYTANYDTYVTETTDGTNIFTTVLIDGSTSGSGGAGCNYPTATHTPKAYNLIGATGGWATGIAGHMTSYLTVQNDQEDPGTGDGTYTFTSEGQVICSVFGDFYDAYFPGLLLTISTTYGSNWGHNTKGSPPDNQYCTWIPACTSVPKSGEPTCGIEGWTSLHPILNTQFCQPFVLEKFLSYEIPATPWTPAYRFCVGKDYPATKAGPCT